MPIPRFTRAQLESVVEDDQGAVALDFRPQRPMRFTAGQHALWHIPGGAVRPFTIASAPEEELVTLGTDLASVSGSPSFVGDTTRILREQGIDPSAIRRDRFWGAQTAMPEQPAPVPA